MDKYSMNFGRKERVLNYACQTYQLSRPSKVGAVMALIRDCQPASFEEWQQAFRELTEKDCIDYIYNLTINRTFDGYLREKSVINDGLAKLFPSLRFEESDPELDHAGDIDYIAKLGDKAIGIQIKPVTASANFGSYSLTERMKASFESFKEQYGGNVFIVFSLDGEIANKDVIIQIREEIGRLSDGSLPG